MSFSLHANELPADGLMRIFHSQVAKARDCIDNDGRVTDDDIHGARKSIKRARATLRLLRPALTAETFKEINLALRDVARPLTQARDAKVLLETLSMLRKHFGAIAECLPTAELEQSLQVQRARTRREIAASTDGLGQLLRTLRKIEADVKQWHIGVDGWALLAPALERVYRNARRAHGRVLQARSDERLHEWRKQTKHLWYALQILTPMRPGYLGELADQADRLAEYLGKDHDLAILRRRIMTADGDEDAIEALESLIDKRRDDLQDRALAVGERLLSKKPKRFIKKMRSMWRKWHEATALPSSPTRIVEQPKQSIGSSVHLH